MRTQMAPAVLVQRNCARRAAESPTKSGCAPTLHDTVAHARTARGKPDRCSHANYREDVGRKLTACALGATRMRCRVPRALAAARPALVQARSHLSPWSAPTSRVQNLKCRVVAFRRPRVRFAGRGLLGSPGTKREHASLAEHRRDGRSFAWPAG